MNTVPLIESHFSPSQLTLFRKASGIAAECGQRLVLVGGIVRDLMLERPLVDVDLMVDHPAGEFVRRFAASVQGGVKHHERFLTYSIQWGKGEKVDVVTAREETYPGQAKLPKVEPSNIEADLKRRDFTINAMAIWLVQDRFGNLLDPFSGANDLKKKVIRVLHSKSFLDDPTRMFRGARFAGRFGFHFHPETKKLMDQAVASKWPALLSPVRRRHEFELILKEDHPLPALRLLEEWKLLSFIHPDWRLRSEHTQGIGSAFEGKDRLDLPQRLALWFKPWGQAKASAMMKDLCFEKSVKKAVTQMLR